MSTQITEKNLRKALREWANPDFGSIYLAPFFAIHETEREKDNLNAKETPIWMWYKKRTIDKCQELIWQILGEWGARRRKTIKNPEKFHEEVVYSVTKLANLFNRFKIITLRDMGKLNQNKYEKILSEILEAIMWISKKRHTKKVQPVLGSKVIHHFFPTIIPVYDDKMISKRVLKLNSFKEFINNDQDGWVFKDYGKQTRLQEYHYYFAYCTQQICDTHCHDLNKIRNIFAEKYKRLSPYSYAKNKKNILWALDAKIAEYCLIGATY